MLAKSREIIHPSGLKIKTPLLVPSFSSKGFDIKNNKSEVKEYVELAKLFITESILVSTYDLHYGFIPSINKMHFAEITFLDSGGYETASYYDFAEVKKKNNKILEWDEKLHLKVLGKWQNDFYAIIINYDHYQRRIKLEKQINKANELFKMFPDQLNDFLIKPEKDEFIDIQKILNSIYLLKEFKIIGITEKELGESILDRMQKISKIRKALDIAGISSPIHIFGCLDPISCILYYCAGAEIFDGLTWLRYSYYNCLTIYTNNFNIVNSNYNIGTLDEVVKSNSKKNNLQTLAHLKQKMIDFSKTKNFEVFRNIGFPNMVEILNNTYTTFKIKEE